MSHDVISSRRSHCSEQPGGRLFFAFVAAARREHDAVRLCGARGLSALLQRDSEVEPRFDEVGRGGDRALEPGRGLRGPIRFDEQHAEPVGGVGRSRVDVERPAIRLFGAGAIAGRAARVAEVRPVRRVVRVDGGRALEGRPRRPPADRRRSPAGRRRCAPARCSGSAPAPPDRRARFVAIAQQRGLLGRAGRAASRAVTARSWSSIASVGQRFAAWRYTASAASTCPASFNARAYVIWITGASGFAAASVFSAPTRPGDAR